jgi:hypothetical protein
MAADTAVKVDSYAPGFSNRDPSDVSVLLMQFLGLMEDWQDTCRVIRLDTVAFSTRVRAASHPDARASRRRRD